MLQTSIIHYHGSYKIYIVTASWFTPVDKARVVDKAHERWNPLETQVEIGQTSVMAKFLVQSHATDVYHIVGDVFEPRMY